MLQLMRGAQTGNVLFLYHALFSTFLCLASSYTLTTNVNTSTCGITKSCWMQPSTCSTGTCTVLLTWKNDINGQSVTFEMEGAVSAQDSWVSFGLSYDQQMGSDSVVDCVYNSQTSSIVVQSSWNAGDSNQPLSNPQLGLVSGNSSTGYVNGHIVCQFQRLIGNSGSSQIYPLDSSTYYILMAQGPASNGVKQHHTNTVQSSSQFNFTSTSGSSSTSWSDGNSLNLIKAHGILMISAWMVFASFGILIPRYFKSAWPESTWCGKKIWFQIHQPCMIITLLLTSAGFIIIFIEANGYASGLPSPAVAHPPMGIIVMALVLINPILAIFRCKPDDKRRVIFNITHFIVGELALLCAVVTIFLGLYTPQLNLPMWTKGVMAGYICFHALIECILAVHMHRNKFHGRTPADCPENIALETVGVDGRRTTSKMNTDSTFKTAVMILDACGLIGFTIALAVQIGITPSS